MYDTFKFKLQKLLDYRAKVEKQKNIQMSDAVSKLTEQESILSNMIEEKEMVFHSMRDRSNEGVLAVHLRQYNCYLSCLHASIGQQIQTVDNVKKEVDECRTSLIGAVKDKQLINNLKEKHLYEYVYKSDKKLEKEIEKI